MSRVSLALWVCMGLVAGCARHPATYPVEGHVKYPDGTPLKGGLITFLSQNDPKKPLNARGTIKDDGTFAVSTFREGDGALEGKHKVVVHPPAVNTRPSEPTPKSNVHSRYGSYDSSGLTVDVSPGVNKVSFTVEKP